jgi:hypothetical protein
VTSAKASHLPPWSMLSSSCASPSLGRAPLLLSSLLGVATWPSCSSYDAPHRSHPGSPRDLRPSPLPAFFNLQSAFPSMAVGLPSLVDVPSASPWSFPWLLHARTSPSLSHPHGAPEQPLSSPARQPWPPSAPLADRHPYTRSRLSSSSPMVTRARAAPCSRRPQTPKTGSPSPVP